MTSPTDMGVAWHSNLPIRRKLTAITLLASGGALIAALATLLAAQLHLARETAASDLRALAENVAINAAGPLAFQDRGAAQSMLEALRTQERVRHARLLDAKGHELARFSTDQEPDPFRAVGPEPHRIRGFTITLSWPVAYRNEPLGHLEIVANVRPMLARIAATATIVALLVLAGALAIAYLLAARLQRTITDPLLSLSGAARTVAAGNDYTLRVKKIANDEIGELTDAFNHMLAEVQERDLALRDTQEQLSEQVQRVTERTADLQAALARLEQESSERLQNEQARHALEKKIEETQRLESLGVLAGGIAHDFNNILTGILASASLARLDLPPQSELAGHMQRIEDSSRRAAELCEQMLAYAGKRKIGTHDLSVNTLVEDTMKLLEASVPRDADLHVELSPVTPAVHGDTSQLRQVVMNLVINAAESLQPGGLRQLRLRTEVRTVTAAQLAGMLFHDNAVAGEYVVIEVSDTGSGISPETLARIFEPFYTTKFTGRGLGLCAALGIVRSHRGALHVESTVGRGSTFRVFLPVVASLPPTIAAKPSLIESRWRGRGTLLVVDDEPAVRAVAARALRQQGYTVLTAADGTEAITVFERDPAAIDGVLLDLTMPNMDGIATTHVLHSIRCDVPILLISGYSREDALERFADAGFVGFLHKPFGIEELTQSVSEHFPGEVLQHVGGSRRS